MDVLLHVKVCKGYLQLADGSIQKQFYEDELYFPLQVCDLSQLLNLKFHCPYNQEVLRGNGPVVCMMFLCWIWSVPD